MKNASIGNKVKFINENLEGTIVVVNNEKEVTVSASDGFEYMVNLNELVVINKFSQFGGLEKGFSVTRKTADNKGAYELPLLKGSVIVADRFYNDFSLLNVWDSKGVFFIIRHKDNIQFTTVKEKELPDNKCQHILKDEIIELTGLESKKKYPNKLRRVAVWDEQNQQVIEVITNQMSWTANTVGELYKSRWQVEIFFREIKQLLHIKSFIGTSENAVMIQIWTALITILILKALKASAKFNWHLSNLVAFIRLNIFVKIDLQEWLDQPFKECNDPPKFQLYQRVLF